MSIKRYQSDHDTHTKIRVHRKPQKSISDAHALIKSDDVVFGASFPYMHFLQKSFEPHSQEPHKTQLVFEMLYIVYIYGEKTSVIHNSSSLALQDFLL